MYLIFLYGTLGAHLLFEGEGVLSPQRAQAAGVVDDLHQPGLGGSCLVALPTERPVLSIHLHLQITHQLEAVNLCCSCEAHHLNGHTNPIDTISFYHSSATILGAAIM